MAVRTESVRLSLEDDFTTGMAKAAVATALLSKELKNLDGNSTKATKAVGPLGNEVEKVGSSTRKNSRDIDKFSGRLRLLTDAALIAGPALIPLGASTIPVLTGALAGLGAAAGGIGVTVLAMHGLGDAFKAIQTYKVDQTAENLQAMRLQLEKAGPDAAKFLQYIDRIAPDLQQLQMISRAGIFPGVEDGIDELLTRLPQVRNIVERLSQEMGDLARDAGTSLGGDDFTAFFDYVETDAEPTLDAFARSTGNVALGLANLLTAFAPVSRDFTGGLVEMTKRFADWSKGLETDQGFQDLVDYIRESGPLALDLLGSIAKTFAAVVSAAAPIGADVLPVVTELVNLIGLIADSPFGTAFVVAAAGFSVYTRAAKVATAATSQLSKVSQSAGKSVEGLGDKARTAGLALLGLEVAGQLMRDLDQSAAGAAPDVEKVTAALISAGQVDLTKTLGVNLKDALGSLDASGVDGLAQSLDNLGAKGGAAGTAVARGLGFFVGSSDFENRMINTAVSVDQASDAFGSLDDALVNIARLGGPARAQQAFDDLAKSQGLSSDQTAELMKQLPQFSDALGGAANSAILTADALDKGTTSAQRFSDALSDLNSWLDKRQAIRDYRDGIADLSKALKNGFQPKDADTLDTVGRNITQVASLIKDKGLRTDFLAGARASLEELANKSGPKAKKQVENLIGALDRYGLTKPPKPPLDVDDKATPKLDRVDSHVRRFGLAKPKPPLDVDDRATPKLDVLDGHVRRFGSMTGTAKVNVDPGNSLTILGIIQRALGGLHDRTINVTVNRRGGVTSSAGGHTADSDGFFGGGYTGDIPAHQVAGVVHGREFVVDAANTARDRAMLEARYGSVPGYAGGGYVADRPSSNDTGLNTPLFTGEGPRYYKRAYAHNRPFALGGPSHWDWPYQSSFKTADDARAFEDWVRNWNIPFALNSRIVDYDMRGFWLKKRPKSWTEGQHFPDTWKTPYDTTFSHESKYATKDNPFYWHGDSLIDERNGQVIFAAGGGLLRGRGGPTDDAIPVMASNGEYMMRAAAVDRYGVDFFDRLNAMHLADGGAVKGTHTKKSPNQGFLTFGSPALNDLLGQATTAAQALKQLNNELDKSEKALDKETQKRDDLVSQMDSLSSTISGGLRSDIFAAPSNPWAAALGGVAGANQTLQSDISRGQQFQQLTGVLSGLGLHGSALQALLEQAAQNNDVGLLQQFANAPQSDLAAYQSLYDLRDQTLSGVGQSVAQTIFGQAYAAQTAVLNAQLTETRGLRQDVKEATKAIKAADKNNTDGQDKQGQTFTAGVNGAAATGKGNQIYNQTGGPR